MTDYKTKRWAQLCDFYAEHQGQGNPTLICGDASNRKFYRVPEGILMDAPCTTEKNHEFVDIASRLQNAKILAPRVLAVDYENGFLLVTDLGTSSFADLIKACGTDQQKLRSLYLQAIDTMVELTKVDTTNLPLYDEAFIKREDDICRDYYFKAHDISLSASEAQIFQVAEKIWTEADLKAPLVAMHRDYHSRNIMTPIDKLNPNKSQIGLIDFQDMVKGPLGYDLASLIRDCYVELPLELVDELLSYAFNRYDECFLHGASSLAEFTRLVDLAGLQRHVKCLGIFNRLALRDGKQGYLKNLPLVEKYVFTVATKYPELTDFANLMHHYCGAKAPTTIPSKAGE